jgi:hypothetical protein
MYGSDRALVEVLSGHEQPQDIPICHPWNTGPPLDHCTEQVGLQVTL